MLLRGYTLSELTVHVRVVASCDIEINRGCDLLRLKWRSIVRDYSKLCQKTDGPMQYECGHEDICCFVEHMINLEESTALHFTDNR